MGESPGGASRDARAFNFDFWFGDQKEGARFDEPGPFLHGTVTAGPYDASLRST